MVDFGKPTATVMINLDGMENIFLSSPYFVDQNDTTILSTYLGTYVEPTGLYLVASTATSSWDAVMEHPGNLGPHSRTCFNSCYELEEQLDMV